MRIESRARPLGRSFSPCLERKIRLSGGEVSYECELVAFEPDFGILRYVMSERKELSGLVLEPGTHTYAIYWVNRSYNLYYWTAPPTTRGRTAPLGCYFNIVDSVFLSRAEFVYRDLVVDLLVKPDGSVVVLDENELPPATDDATRRVITAAKETLLGHHGKIIAEAEALLASGLAEE